MKKNTNLHDRGYKRLFSNKTFVSKLFQGFVLEKWVKDIDFRKLERVETSFISKKFAKRESDILYKVKYKKREAYIYLLLEFQSTVDKYMALRLLHYIVEIYEMLLKEEKYRKKKLPPIFPLVLYNGEKQWGASTNIRDLIESGDLTPYVPDFRYVRICENEFDKKTLLKINNIVSGLFLIENLNEKEIEGHFTNLIKIIEKETDSEAIREFNRWIAYQFTHDRVEKELLEEIDKATSKKEASNMFAKTAQKLKENWLQEGIQEGMVKGELKVLISLLKKKFKKDFTPDIKDKVLKLKKKQIAQIVGKIFELKEIEELKRYI